MQNRLMLILAAVWIPLVALGFLPLLRYEAKPGEAAAQLPQTWPVDSRLAHADNAMTLIMFVHPRCVCSNASLDQLAKTREAIEGSAPVKTLVVFELPAGSGADWHSGPLWQKARAIPGVEVVADINEQESARFGATTSGETFIYSGGKLLFHGGLTPGRGHEGDCLGMQTACDILRGAAPAQQVITPAFGCELLNCPVRK